MQQFNRLVLGECAGISVVTYSGGYGVTGCFVWIISAWLSYHILDSRNKDSESAGAGEARFLEHISKNRGEEGGENTWPASSTVTPDY